MLWHLTFFSDLCTEGVWNWIQNSGISSSTGRNFQYFEFLKASSETSSLTEFYLRNSRKSPYRPNHPVAVSGGRLTAKLGAEEDDRRLESRHLVAKICTKIGKMDNQFFCVVKTSLPHLRVLTSCRKTFHVFSHRNGIRGIFFDKFK